MLRLTGEWFYESQREEESVNGQRNRWFCWSNPCKLQKSQKHLQNDAERDLITTIVITGQIPQGIGNISVLSPSRQVESTKAEVLTEGSAGKVIQSNDIVGPHQRGTERN